MNIFVKQIEVSQIATPQKIKKNGKKSNRRSSSARSVN